LQPVEDVEPWPTGGPNLHWYALTYGTFGITAGGEQLLRYTPEILARWGGPELPDYQVAGFVDEVLGAYEAAVAPLPPFFETLARDWAFLAEFRRASRVLPDKHRVGDAWWWLSQRDAGFGFLAQRPTLLFLRVEDEILLCWDNRDTVSDGIPVWNARFGTFRMSFAAYRAAAVDVVEALLTAMRERIERFVRWPPSSASTCPADVQAERTAPAATTTGDDEARGPLLTAKARRTRRGAKIGPSAGAVRPNGTRWSRWIAKVRATSSARKRSGWLRRRFTAGCASSAIRSAWIACPPRPARTSRRTLGGARSTLRAPSRPL
jgi:hypothetical protein